MKALVGSQHNVRCADGRVRKFRVRELSQYPNAKFRAICLYCRETWDTVEEMTTSHPTHETMALQEEPHVIALWSADLPEGEKDLAKAVGLLSDEHPTHA